MTTTTETTAAHVAAEIHRRQRFVVVSHARPDGDAIGSCLAMALALERLGKYVRVVSRDPVPPQMLAFPRVETIQVVDQLNASAEAVIVMECGDLERTGIRGLEHGYVINVDHHPGNSLFGAINWFDLTAAACGEMVFTLVGELGVALTREIATHVYIAILTDTGSFHYSNITPRTFDICRQCIEAGVDPPSVARAIFDSNNLGRLRLFGAVLHKMQLDLSGRIATLCVDEQLARDCGGTYEDTEGLVNLPLTVKDIVAVAFFKQIGEGHWRVSLRSKGDIDVNSLAREFGGGGHMNASGCSVQGEFAELRATFETRLRAAVDEGERRR
jgi:phosphoesterase RecJ-like protein